MLSHRSRLARLEAVLLPRPRVWGTAFRVMVNESTTDAEVAELLGRKGIATEGENGPWVIVRRLIGPAGGDVLPNVPYLARTSASA